MRKKPVLIYLIFIAAGLSLFSPRSFAEIFPRVLETAGKAVVWDKEKNQFQSIESGRILKEGDKIETAADAFVDVARDAALENVFRVGPDSRVTFLNNSPFRLSLDEGSIWLIKEEGSEARILTKQFLVAMRQGGFLVESSGGLTSVKVFGDSAKVYEKKPNGYSESFIEIPEGFSFSSGKKERMGYPEYSVWQKWYKANDERRDGLTITRP